MHNTAPSFAFKTLGQSGSAVLVLDTNGRIEKASAAACALWQALPDALIGVNFPDLFVFEVTSHESGWVQSQWEVLLAAAQLQPVTLQLQPKDADPFDCSLRIEKAGDSPVSYFAFISLPAPPVARVVSAPPFVTVLAPDNFLALLNDRSPLGFSISISLKTKSTIPPLGSDYSATRMRICPTLMNRGCC